MSLGVSIPATTSTHPNRYTFLMQVSFQLPDADFSKVKNACRQSRVGFAFGKNLQKVRHGACATGSNNGNRNAIG